MLYGEPYMRSTDARIDLLRRKVDAIADTLLDRGMDEVIDSLDHYLLGTLRQPYIDSAVFDKVTYYVNNVIANFGLEIKW